MGKKAISLVIAGILSLGMVMTSAFAAETANTEADWITANNAVSTFVETNDTAFDAELAAKKLSLGNALDIGDNVCYENESNNYYYQANILYDDYTVHAYVGGYDLDWYVFDLSSAATVRITAVCKYSGLQFGFFDRYGDDCLASAKVSYQGDGYYGGSLSYSLPAGRYTLLFLSGNRTNMSYTFYASIPTKLAAPTISVTINSNGKPVINWTAVDGATGYKVYRSTDGVNYTVMYTAPSSKLSVTHSGAVSGSTYYYKVCAISDDVTGPFSQPASNLCNHVFSVYVINDDATCMNDGTITVYCEADCGASQVIDNPGSKTDHLYTTYYYDDNATCQADGTETASCDYGCGTTHTRTAENSTGEHKYSVYVINDDATCMSDGTITVYCEFECGANQTTTNPDSKVDHTYTTYTYNNDATCQADGTETASCDFGCGITHTRTAENTKTEHSFLVYSINDDATCINDGTITVYCEMACGTVKTVTNPGSKVDHKYTTYFYNEDATCTANGTETAKCDFDCGNTDTRTAEESKLDHVYSVYVINDDVTCMSDGTISVYCEFECGASQTVTNPDSKVDHKYTTYTYNNDATCQADGTETASCDFNCGNTHTRTAENTKVDHTYTTYTYNNDATCQADGTETAKCDFDCGNTDTRTAEESKLDHVYSVYVINDDATCMSDGTISVYCEFECGASQTVTNPDSKVDHKYTTYTYNNDATCQADGTETASCDFNCGNTHTRTAENTKVDHTYTTYTYNNDATCQADGTETASCDFNCGNTHTCTAENTKVDHTYTTYTYNNDATCQADGTETANCDFNCGNTHTRTAENTKVDHTYTTYTYNNDATCQADGTETASCDFNCGNTHTRTAENTKVDHCFENYVFNNDASPVQDGTETSTCKYDCGNTDTRIAEGTATGLQAPVITVTTNADSGKPIVKWSAVDFAEKYEVYVSNTKNGSFRLLHTAAQNKLNITHTGAKVGQTYFYKVRAVSGDVKSEFSLIKGVWCDLSAPTIKVSTRGSDGKPVVSWSKVEHATGYEIYVSNTKNGTYNKLYTASADKLSLTHTGAKAGETYFYKVRAIYKDNTSCNSAMSAAKGVWCDLARPTVSISNRSSDGKPVISWTKVEGATGYEVYCSDRSNGDFKLIYTALSTKLSVAHAGAKAGQTYYYKVRAIGDNRSCDSAMTEAQNVWCNLAQPTVNVSNRASDGKPTISWSMVDGATGYNVYVSNTKDGAYRLLYTAKADKLNITHTGAKAGEAYYYKVQALCGNTGNCDSTMSTAKGIYSDLARPTLKVELNQRHKPYISWSRVDGASKYQVYCSTNGGEYKLIYTAKSDDFDVTHTGAKAGNTYTYKVIAICGSNSKCNSAYSATKSVTVR